MWPNREQLRNVLKSKLTKPFLDTWLPHIAILKKRDDDEDVEYILIKSKPFSEIRFLLQDWGGTTKPWAVNSRGHKKDWAIKAKHLEQLLLSHNLYFTHLLRLRHL